MLKSGLNSSSSALSLDLLTLSDLEMMKVKRGLSTSSSNLRSSVNSTTSETNQGKRYAILTYTGEFDRVHYPLPLSFDAQPNVPALLRTVKRLRKTLKERSYYKESGLGPGSGTLADGQEENVLLLRRENNELKHRLRLATSRSNKTYGSVSLPFSLFLSNLSFSLVTTRHSQSKLMLSSLPRITNSARR